MIRPAIHLVLCLVAAQVGAAGSGAEVLTRLFERLLCAVEPRVGRGTDPKRGG